MFLSIPGILHAHHLLPLLLLVILPLHPLVLLGEVELAAHHDGHAQGHHHLPISIKPGSSRLISELTNNLMPSITQFLGQLL